MSRLLDGSATFREPLIARNGNSRNDEYSGTHPNALSDGDEKGKGELNGSIGSASDITNRSQSIARNQYSSNQEYDASRA